MIRVEIPQTGFAMTLHERIVAKIDAFLRAHRKSDRWLSLQFGKDHKVVARIREGQSSLQTISKVEDFMDTYEAPTPEEAA